MRYLILLFLYMDSQLCQCLLLKILLSPHWMKFLLCYPDMYEFFLGSLSYRLVDLSILAKKHTVVILQLYDLPRHLKERVLPLYIFKRVLALLVLRILCKFQKRFINYPKKCSLFCLINLFDVLKSASHCFSDRRS